MENTPTAESKPSLADSVLKRDLPSSPPSSPPPHQATAAPSPEPEPDTMESGFPFETALKLRRGELVEITAWLLKRTEEVKTEMGRAERGSCTGWMQKRERALAMQAKDFSHRKSEIGGVFEHSNESMNAIKRNVDQQVAKINAEFFGTEPFFAAGPEGSDDIALAGKVDKDARWKLSHPKCDLKFTLRQAVKQAFIKGEEIVCVSHTVEKQDYMAWEDQVLINLLRQPVYTSRGRAVKKSDWILDPLDPEEKTYVCKHDVSLTRPAYPMYARKLVKKSHVLYKGPVVRQVEFRDFLCPLTVGDIHEADFFCELRDEALADVARNFNRPDLVSGDGHRTGAFWKLLGLARNLLGMNDTSAKAIATQPDFRKGEGEDQIWDPKRARVQTGYYYFNYTRDKAIGPQSLVFVLAMPHEGSKVAEPLYWNFVGDCMPICRRNYEVIRRKPVPNRWYGLGAYEEYGDDQKLIDLQLNRQNFANGTSGNVIFWNKHLVEESNRKFIPGAKVTWTPKSDTVDAAKIMTVIPLIQPTATMDRIMMMKMQALQLEMGITNEAEGASSGLDSSETLGGVNSNARVADNLTGETMSDLEEGIIAVIRAAVLMRYYHMDQQEVFQYLEGKTAGLDIINRDEVEGLMMNVKLLLSRKRAEQLLLNNDKAESLLQSYLALYAQFQQMALPMSAFSNARDLYLQRAKSLEIQNADTVFFDPADPKVAEEIRQLLPQKSAPGPGAGDGRIGPDEDRPLPDQEAGAAAVLAQERNTTV